MHPYPGFPGFAFQPGGPNAPPMYHPAYHPYPPYPPYPFLPHPFTQYSMHTATSESSTNSSNQASSEVPTTYPQQVAYAWAKAMNAVTPPKPPSPPVQAEPMYSIWPSRASTQNAEQDNSAEQREIGGHVGQPVAFTFSVHTGLEIKSKPVKARSNPPRKRRRADMKAVAEWHRQREEEKQARLNQALIAAQTASQVEQHNGSGRSSNNAGAGASTAASALKQAVRRVVSNVRLQYLVWSH